MLRIKNSQQVSADLKRLREEALNASRVRTMIKYLVSHGADRTLLELKNEEKLRKVNWQYETKRALQQAPVVSIAHDSRWLLWQLHGTKPHTIAPINKKILSNLLKSFPRNPLMVSSTSVKHPGTQPNQRLLQKIEKATMMGVKDIMEGGQRFYIQNGKYIQIREKSGRFGPGNIL